MRVAIVTLHREINFGSALQAVALARVVGDLGHQGVLVDYTREGRVGLGAIRHRYRTFRGSGPRRLVTSIEASVELCAARLLRFGPFVRRGSRHTRRYRGIEQLRRLPPQAEVLMTGSDQVWNANYNLGVDRGFFLDFGLATTRRVAYAASFGTDEIVDGTWDETRTLLRRYSAIGVREIQGERILDSLGLPSQVVVDPTILLDRPRWLGFASSRSRGVPREPYLLVYCVEDDRREVVAEIATAVARVRGLRIVQVAPAGRQDRVSGLRGPLRASPAQFLRMFADAAYVVTSSFHGTAFSLTFEKQFVSVPPPQFASRAQTILAAVGLSERLTSSLPTALALEDLDYDQVRPTLESLRGTSLAFLCGALGTDQPGQNAR
ncbi:polysaccharide pyruvyl transferase family protein [Nocardia salmonicida]|uniref:polysaccharide pyruvyl transferase family protein n=1 Tax=Nocardia salmonicida TaxID=53431 RepID=UPI0033CC8EE0